MNNLEFLTGEKFRDQPIPGSKTYFFNNRREKNKYESNLSDGEILNLKKYLPKKFNRFNPTKTPNQLLQDLGWKYDENIGKFYHHKYQNDNNSPILFDCGVKMHNEQRYLVPLSKRGHLDEHGLTWDYKNVSTIWYLERNVPIDFWSTRGGKRMAKYIEYRKRRAKRQQMYSK